MVKNRFVAAEDETRSGPMSTVSAVLFVMAVVAGCASSPPPIEAKRLSPPVRVCTDSGLLWSALNKSPSFAFVHSPDEAELVVRCAEDVEYDRTWAFPGVLVNMFTLPLGYFTFAYECSVSMTGRVRIGSKLERGEWKFEEQVEVSRTFFGYQKKPESDDDDLYPGFLVARQLASRELGRKICLRIAEEWAKDHPGRVLPAEAIR